MALTRSAFSEWYDNSNKMQVINNWLQEVKKPEIHVTPLSILHYNIRHFFSNQCDLLDMVTQYNPTIISLNELGTHVPDKIIKQLLFSYNIFTSKGTNPHGGVVLAIDKKINSIQIKIDQLNIIAVQLIVGDLNAKHPNWGCTSINHKGKILAEWLDVSEMYEI
ncbi:unnamed protein product [Rotaria sp. Silwood2]|nr:unnamed protein product [Rotaria sp. Silwood2]CAF2974890.1 unnamed protein product [Rotaria sp. Silwood2]CAF3344066.1 unnamed protein product [Rotaria sp. Silwood2]CAF4032115.1 unnamed protein product [Rotaria sp. Silwood2]CAF4176435.1 unnamed protein product [Rotaria sp. Silwood2]